MHIKYRPNTWDEVIGNTEIIKSLKSLTYSRPILLQGTRGCGKTTLAYIIAKEFGANDLTITDYNCGKDTGKNDIDLRMEELTRSHIFGSKQVLILDEVHLLSSQAKTTLLKPTESDNLSKNSLIIACTTEPERLPVPLYERFIPYQVKPLTKKEGLQLLNRVTDGEGITISKDLKVLIIDKSEGIPRRILTGLARAKDVDSLDEAAYLLDIVAFEDNRDVLDLFKSLITTSVPFANTKAQLKELLKTHSPDAVRVGLMNITAGRIMSDYWSNDDKKTLVLYEALREAKGYPEKANLVVALLKGKY